MNAHTKKIIQQHKDNAIDDINKTNTNTNIKTNKSTKTKHIEQDEDKENKLEFFNLSRYRGYIKLYDVLVCYPNLSLIDRIIYCTCRAYAQLSPHKNITYISSNTIANRLNISRATVTKSLSTLQKLNIISICKNEKNQRIIKIEKDFEIVQPEEEEYWDTHKEELKNFNNFSNLMNLDESNELDELNVSYDSKESYAFDLE